MSDSKQNLDPDSPAYDAPSGSPERKVPSMSPDRDGTPTLQNRIEKLAPHLRIVKPNEAPAKDPSDAFAAALAMAMREQHDADLLSASSALQRRLRIPAAAKFAVAIAGAALAALGYVVMFPSAQSSSEQHTSTVPQPFVPPAPQRPAPKLTMRDHGGTFNEPIALGVSVEPADPDMTVTIKGLPIGARLTAGEQMSLSEWRVPAQDIANTIVVPPRDFVGDINLSAELRNASDAPLVMNAMHLAWNAPPPSVTAPIAPAPQAARQMASTLAAPSTPPSPQVDPAHELSANEVGGLIRLAQQMLTLGDVKGGRTLLLRAADAHDPRAADALAKTYDPTLSQQSANPDSGPDLAQARSWYQKAREWGSPEAQHQLEVLTMTYGR